MRRIVLGVLAAFALGAYAPASMAQGFGQQSPMGNGAGRQPHEEPIVVEPTPDKPDKVAKKAYAAGMKYLNKAHALEDEIAKTTDPDKKAKLSDKLGDAYGSALDQFTEVLRNQNNRYEAWSNVGLVHLRLGAYRESIDDYNHALQLKPDSPEAIQHRGEAYLETDRLDEVEAAYMDLFYHQRALADEMIPQMQNWVKRHRITADGVRPGDLDAFDKWLSERIDIAKTTAANAPVNAPANASPNTHQS